MCRGGNSDVFVLLFTVLDTMKAMELATRVTFRGIEPVSAWPA
jgi:hypothetical protein